MLNLLNQVQDQHDVIPTELNSLEQGECSVSGTGLSLSTLRQGRRRAAENTVPGSMSEVKLLIAEDEPVARQAMARLFDLETDTKEVFADLTEREREVLKLVASGKRNVSNILSKLQANDRTEAALYAARHGLVE